MESAYHENAPSGTTQTGLATRPKIGRVSGYRVLPVHFELTDGYCRVYTQKLSETGGYRVLIG